MRCTTGGRVAGTSTRAPPRDSRRTSGNRLRFETSYLPQARPDGSRGDSFARDRLFASGVAPTRFGRAPRGRTRRGRTGERRTRSRPTRPPLNRSPPGQCSSSIKLAPRALRAPLGRRAPLSREAPQDPPPGQAGPRRTLSVLRASVPTVPAVSDSGPRDLPHRRTPSHHPSTPSVPGGADGSPHLREFGSAPVAAPLAIAGVHSEAPLIDLPSSWPRP
jgi:hypothetical protein